MNAPVRKTLPMPDGEISFLDWEGAGPPLHFSHATGFNAETYRILLAPLADRFRIVASDLRGHGFSTVPARPGSASDWTVYRDDLARILERVDAEPAVLSGHSMGATVSLMAAALRPESVRALVLLEPVMIPQFANVFQFLARLFGVNPGPNLADRAEQRRDRFPSFEAALASYTGRGAFRSWPSEVIADYLHGGLIADSEGVHLACKPSWEAETFRATPYGMARLVHQLKCPITLVYGTIASTCRESEAAHFARAGARIIKIEGASHFLPMEHPDIARDAIRRFGNS